MRDMTENIGRHKLLVLAVVIVIVAAGFAICEMNKKVFLDRNYKDI